MKEETVTESNEASLRPKVSVLGCVLGDGNLVASESRARCGHVLMARNRDVQLRIISLGVE